MKSREIAQRRMHSQRLWGPAFKTPEDVVHWLGALQAQEFPIAKWSVAQRANGVSNAAMDQVFAEGAILRTHLLRPTWHFVLPADIRWLLDVSAPRVNAMNASYYRKFELDDELFAKSNALLAKALKGGRQLTRKELAAMLERAGITANGLRLGYILMRAELDAVICSGALRGRQHTYASLEEQAPQTKTLDREEGLAELTRRYFTSRGPATLKDYSRWSTLTVADAKIGLDMAKSQLEHEVVDGRTYWFGASPTGGRPASKRIDLVQGLDEYIMSYSESRDVLLGPLATDGILREVVFNHAILLNGQLIGQWRPVTVKKSVVVETLLYRALDRSEARELDAAAERFGRFLEVPAEVMRPRL